MAMACLDGRLSERLDAPEGAEGKTERESPTRMRPCARSELGELRLSQNGMSQNGLSQNGYGTPHVPNHHNHLAA